MKVALGEAAAVAAVIGFGREYGFGNLIAHLQTAWAAKLMEDHHMPERVAREASGGPGYPFKLQADVVLKGEWDETGERYRA